MNLQPRWPKMLPRVVLERLWRLLGGALGRPREAQEGAKSMLGGCFFKLKKHLYNKLSWKQFLLVFGAPRGSKNLHFALEGLQKSAFQEVAF